MAAPVASADDAKLLTRAEMLLGKKVDSITSTGFSSLYEVVSEGKIVYVNKELTHIFSGYIYDVSNRTNLTAERLKMAQRPELNKLPFADALHSVRGNGSRMVVVFSDPNCQYCRKLEEELGKLGNVKVVTFLYPVLSDDSAKLARDIWCSPDPSTSWSQWMTSKVKPKEHICASPNERNLLLGKKLNINATPVIFLPDGDRITGFTSMSNIEAKLRDSESRSYPTNSHSTTEIRR